MSHFRAYPRLRTRIALDTSIARSDARVRIVDLGMGGAGVSVSPPLVAGARLELVLRVPNRWDPLVIPARVAWANGKRAGLAFEHRDERDTYALFELLSAQVFDA